MKKQDVIEEAICAGPDGARCGCWDRECPRGCGLAFEALDIWKDVRKTLTWLSKNLPNEPSPCHPDFREIVKNLIERIEDEPSKL
jgi:hypothetical protein